MDKFEMDYQNLESKLTQKKTYRYAEVKDRLRKVAFDVVKFVDSDNIDGLWQIQHSDDGEFIVAMYEDMPEVNKTASDWSVVSNASGDHLNIFYKGEPIKGLSLASIGIPAEDSYLVRRELPVKLASNQQMVNSLLNELPEEQKKYFITKYPELGK